MLDGEPMARLTPDCIDEISREAGSNNGGAAKNAAVGRGELVDPRRHQALDRIRQLGHAARLARDGHQLGQEERVTARPLGQRLDLVRQEWRFLRRSMGKCSGLSCAERLKLDYDRF